MKRFIFVVLSMFLFVSSAHAGWVKGYTRKDGTYVNGYERSSPDQYKWNNYGPSTNSQERINPYIRDKDKDGIPNYLDKDDNNNGISDDNDNHQYGR